MQDQFFDDDENRKITISIEEGGVLVELEEYMSSFWLLPKNVDAFCKKLKDAASIAKQTRPIFEENEAYWVSKNCPHNKDDLDT